MLLIFIEIIEVLLLKLWLIIVRIVFLKIELCEGDILVIFNMYLNLGGLKFIVVLIV